MSQAQQLKNEGTGREPKQAEYAVNYVQFKWQTYSEVESAQADE